MYIFSSSYTIRDCFLLTNDFPFTTKQSAWAIESHRIHLAPISASRAPALRLYSGSCHHLHCQCSALAHGKPWGWDYHSHQQCSIFPFKTQVLKEILTTMHMETTVVPSRFPLLWDVSTLHLFLRLGFKSSLRSLPSHPDHFQLV